MTHNLSEPFIILMAEDDEDDRFLVEKALVGGYQGSEKKLYFVQDGQSLLDYLHLNNGFNEANAPKPDLIFLDLNMPRLDGREALKEIKNDRNLRQIPVIILTTSEEDEDITKTYDLGANSFITKPISFEDLVSRLTSVEKYWFETVKLMPRAHQ